MKRRTAERKLSRVVSLLAFMSLSVTFMLPSAGAMFSTANVSAANPAPTVSTLILDPVLLSEGIVGTTQQLSVRAFGPDQAALPGASISLTVTGAEGLIEKLTGVTDPSGVAHFTVVNLAGVTEFIASAGPSQSNAIEVSPILE